jgi:Putative Actinobacterial Holin-X, holin superfamily III
MLEQEFNKAEELALQLKAYINTEIELAKLIAAEKLSKVFSNLIAVIFVSFVFLLCVLFASFTVAYLVGEWTGEMWMGFLAVALFYLLLGIIAWFTREKFIRVPIMNAILRQLFDNEIKDKYHLKK